MNYIINATNNTTKNNKANEGRIFPSASDIVYSQHADERQMNITFMKKIQKARKLFRQKGLKKNGKNNFQKYDYWKLDDILAIGANILDECELSTWYNFSTDPYILEVYDLETGYKKEVSLTNIPELFEKNVNNSLQNIGRATTYLRRYLYIQLFDIAEIDEIDKFSGKKEYTKKRYTTTQKTRNNEHDLEKIVIKIKNEITAKGGVTSPQTVLNIAKEEYPEIYPQLQEIYSGKSYVTH